MARPGSVQRIAPVAGTPGPMMWATAAIALTLRARKDSKYQNPGEQVRVRKQDRVTLVKMDPVKPAAASAAEENQA